MSHAFASKAECLAYFAGAGSMAAGLVNEADIIELVDNVPAGRRLPMIFFLDSIDQPTRRVVCFLLKHRRDAFLLAMPATELVRSMLDSLDMGESSLPVFTEVQLPCKTPRRRSVEDLPVILTDIPLVHLGWFRKANLKARKS